VATTEFVLAETGTSRHVIMMHFGNGDMENCSVSFALA